MSRSKLLVLLVWMLPWVTVVHGVAQAQDGPPANGENMESLEALLNESVVTTASRSAERASTAPSAMFTITAEEIRLYGMRSIDEALGFLGVGMRVEKVRDYYTGLDVGARGLMLRDYGRHLLVLLDGHVMNSQASGEITLHEGLGVPLEAIDHIEVMLGAGSIMYGANAVTAVVHVVTKDAAREHGVHLVSELSIGAPNNGAGRARLPDDKYDLGYHYRFGLGASDDFRVFDLPGSATVRAEWQHYDSQTYYVVPEAGDGRQLRANENTWGGYASHHLETGSLLASLRLGDVTLRAQSVFYNRNMPLVSLFDEPNTMENRSAVRLDLSHVKQLSQALHLTSRLYADYMRQQDRTYWTSIYWCAPGQIDGCEFRSEIVSRWLGLEQQLRYEPRADGSLATTIGYDVRLRDGSGRPADYRDMVTGEFPPATWLPYFHEQSVLGALFIQQIWRPWSWLTLNLGARLDMDSLFGVSPSPRLAALFTPRDDMSLRVSYSEAFRGPTAAELYASDPTYVVSPARLGAEAVHTAEIEWQQRVAFLSFVVRGWYARYEHFIDQRPATADEVTRGLESHQLTTTADPAYVVTYANLETITAWGGTLTVQARPVTGLTLMAATTISRSDALGRGEWLWPLAFGNFRAAYAFEPNGPALAFASTFAFGRYAFNAYADDPNVDTPGRVSDALDMRLTFTAPVASVAGLRYRIGTGLRVFPDTPYRVEGPTESAPNTPVQYNHEQPQLYLLLGVSYDD